MARKAKKKTPSKQSAKSPTKALRARPVTALAVFALALVIGVALFGFDLTQSRHTTTDADPGANMLGIAGAESSFWLFYSLGAAAWTLPLFLAAMGVRFLLPQAGKRRSIAAIGCVCGLLGLAGLLAMFESMGMLDGGSALFKGQVPEDLGGAAGTFLSANLVRPIGSFGGFMVLFGFFVVGSTVVFTNGVGRLMDYMASSYHRFLDNRAKAKEERRKEKLQSKEDRAQAKQAAREEKKRLKKEAAAERKAAQKDAKAASREEAKAEAKAPRAAFSKAKSKANEPVYIDANDDYDEGRPSLLKQAPLPPPGMRAADEKLRRKTGAPFAPSGTKSPFAQPVMDEPEPPIADAPSKTEAAAAETSSKPRLDPSTIKVISGETMERAVASIPERRGDYVFPPIDLLAEAQASTAHSEEDHRGTMEALVRTLDEFGVKVIPGEIHTGPVITRYEVKPAPGVRVEKIVNLDKNIALGLKALSVRILAPVPGKGTVGIEVPNKQAQEVRMREIIESRAWAESSAEIPVVLGKDVTGKPIVADLTKMPHLLIAGSTGSGKTVCINAVIASLLYRYGPEDLRFIMVDPKVVEMQGYNNLPHMLIPVVTEPKKVPGALKWLIAEMDRRYQIFAKEGVRNIAGFNAKLDARNQEEQAKAEEMDASMTPEERAAIAQVGVPRDDDVFEVPRKKLPYICCIIDELADLMMVAPADIETCIARLAQLARAAGIHLVLATQRPSVNVITGVIKANLPSRISFRVASKVDSRTILDGGGAEALIGKGDMLFIPPGASNMLRAQGAFVSDEEIVRIVEYIEAENDPPNYAEEVQQQIDSGGDDSVMGGDDDGDELLPDAIEVLRSTKRASTSMLQRRLRIGYNRAARLMEVLEDRGIVGPENGSSPREILVDLDSM